MIRERGNLSLNDFQSFQKFTHVSAIGGMTRLPQKKTILAVRSTLVVLTLTTKRAMRLEYHPISLLLRFSMNLRFDLV